MKARAVILEIFDTLLSRMPAVMSWFRPVNLLYCCLLTAHEHPLLLNDEFHLSLLYRVLRHYARYVGSVMRTYVVRSFGNCIPRIHVSLLMAQDECPLVIASQGRCTAKVRPFRLARTQQVTLIHGMLLRCDLGCRLQVLLSNNTKAPATRDLHVQVERVSQFRVVT